MTAGVAFEDRIRDVADFPRPGITFKDITPLLADPVVFAAVVASLAGPFMGRVDKVVGIEARGFMVATPVAQLLGTGFVPVRKPGKLPGPVQSESYELEYGSDALEIHSDALVGGERVLVVDDVIATGGTAVATARLVESLGAKVVGLGFVIELEFLDGRRQLEGYEVLSLVTYA